MAEASEYFLTEEQLQAEFDGTVRRYVFDGYQPQPDQPVLVLLGAQPAAGKSQAVQATQRRYEGADLVPLTGDELRSLHPEYDKLRREEPQTFETGTAQASGPWVCMSIDYALKNRYSLVLEGVFRDPEMTISTAERFAAAGFRVEIVALGVREEISRPDALHRFLKNVEDGPAAAAVELFASLLAEIRAYGEGVVIVEQIPSKILPDVIKNSALKIMHRLPAEDDRRAVGATMNLQSEQSENVVALPPGQAAIAADGMDRPVLTAIPHGEHAESADDASTEPPLLSSRSPLCGTSCRREPCSLRTMNDSHHRSLEPLPLVWADAAASAQAMGKSAPAPAAPVAAALTALPHRDLECTLVYAVERAVAAHESLIRDEVDPADFAERLYAVLSAALLGTPPPTGDPQRYTYANYRFRDVLSVVHQARRTMPDGPHTYPDHEAQWASRGLRLTGTSAADHRRQIRALPGCAPDKAYARTGDVTRSGLRGAITLATGGRRRNTCGGPSGRPARKGRN
ncbi:zeta toxin family protein (plasmid) [Streptomyces sp. NBC_00708]